MKKITFFFTLFTISFFNFAQKALLVNGGQFGNPNEDVNLVIYDTQTKASTLLDTIHTGSTQDICFEGDFVYVAAQDSVVKYDLTTQSRMAAERFEGPSTKTLAVHGNELIVGNWYGKSSSNLYFYDKSSLSLIDSISSVEKGAKSILIHNGFAYINQNEETAGFEDTLGFVIKVDLSSRSITDTIQVANYNGDVGTLIMKPDQSGFYTINSVSNTISIIDFNTLNVNNTSFSHNLNVGSRSQYSVFNDTLFLRMNGGIGALNLSNLAILDSLIIDTVVTAFTYDTTNHRFLVTQTDFFSYTFGKIYDRNGLKVDTFVTGFSPEVIDMIPDRTVGIKSISQNYNSQTIRLYPNPAVDQVQLEWIADQALKGDEQLKIYDLNGRLLQEERISGKRQILDLSNLDSGMYLMTILSDHGYQTERLIIQ